MDIHRTSFLWLALWVFQPQSSAQSQDRTLPLIPPGTVVGNEDGSNWNRAILLATPRISSGDTTKLSEPVRTAVSQLTLTILATVKHDAASDGPASDGTGTYRLDEVGVGYSVPIREQQMTISSDSATRLGARLDFYSRQMLSQNEKQIAKLKLVVRTATLVIFDAPAIMLRDGQHKDFVTRHLIWIDANTGKLAVVIWLLSTDRDGRASVAERSLRVVAPGVKEDRKIHVDGRSFFLGIPTERAFALEDLPPGVDVAWTGTAQSLAALQSYTSQELSEFASALNLMLQGK